MCGGEGGPLEAGRERPGLGHAGRGQKCVARRSPGNEFLGCLRLLGVEEVVFAQGWLSAVGRSQICTGVGRGGSVFPMIEQEVPQGAGDVFHPRRAH